MEVTSDALRKFATNESMIFLRLQCRHAFGMMLGYGRVWFTNMVEVSCCNFFATTHTASWTTAREASSTAWKTSSEIASFRDRTFLKCFVWWFRTYGWETWTLLRQNRQNIEAETWFYRRILRFPLTVHQNNVAVLQRTEQVRKLLCCVEQKQLIFWEMLYAKESLKILVEMVDSRKKCKWCPAFYFHPKL